MRSQNSDTDTLVAALQSDLPSADDDARMRAKLAAAGACVGASLVGAAALQAASINTAVGSGVIGGATQGAVVGAKGAGLLSTVIGALPLGSVGVKTLVVAGALASGVSYPLVAPKLASVFQRENVTQPRAASAHAPALVPAAAQAGQLVAVEETRTPPAESPIPMAEPRVAPKAQLAERRGVEAEKGAVEGVAGGQPTNVQGASSKPRGAHASRVDITRPTMTNVPDTSSAALAEETQLIERALRAQRANDKAAARHWLNVHRERFPEGSLTIERTRMWAQLQD